MPTNNTRYDLELEIKQCAWICEKIRNSDRYAQNMYAALCNNQFVKQDVISILKDDYWSCSWRYSGGIIADIQCTGSYMDWYCTGIRDVEYDEENNKVYDKKGYVTEGDVTDEIRSDLLKLGWTVVLYDPDTET